MSLCLAAASALSGAARGGPARRAGTARASFQRDVLPILRRSCTNGTGCHAGDTAAAGQRFDQPDPYATLVNAPSSLQHSRMRVKPSKPDDSVLWLKITGKHKHAGIFGDRMPPNKPLPPSDRRRIERWILAGAPR